MLKNFHPPLEYLLCYVIICHIEIPHNIKAAAKDSCRSDFNIVCIIFFRDQDAELALVPANTSEC